VRKTPQDIKNIRNACRVADLGFKYVLNEIKLGTSEKDLSRKLSKFLQSRSDGLAFRTIVAFGENSSQVHHRPTKRKLRLNDVILFDFGVKVNGFCSDLSRTVVFGKMNKKQKEAYGAVLKTQEKALKFLKSSIGNHKSILASDVDKIARQYLISKGYPSIPHGLGHGIGKKVHSGPRLAPKSRYYLKESMVFTIEPAVYLKTFGIRIEDDILVKKNAIEILTRSPKQLIVIR
jgi:Xaa-Pro aminopeptidase